MTKFIDMTELWHEGEYQQVATIIVNEDWPPRRVAEFVVYFSKYVGIDDSQVLCKLI